MILYCVPLTFRFGSSSSCLSSFPLALPLIHLGLTGFPLSLSLYLSPSLSLSVYLRFCLPIPFFLSRSKTVFLLSLPLFSSTPLFPSLSVFPPSCSLSTLLLSTLSLDAPSAFYLFPLLVVALPLTMFLSASFPPIYSTHPDPLS